MTTSRAERPGTDGPLSSALLAGVETCYVWTWLPGAADPVVAGRLDVTRTGGAYGPVLSFTYGRSYRERPDALALFTPELPLRSGTFDPERPVTPGREPGPLAGCLRDASPDAWGRRVVNLRLGPDPDVDLSELTYLLASSSDRIGALDFQLSATDFVARGSEASLDQLVAFAGAAESGEPIPPDLAAAAGHGTSIGGARPKALLEHDGRHLIAKFSSSTDDRPVVKAEALAMTLARLVGIDVPDVSVVRAAGKDVLLVERFDRTADGGRRAMVSGLTVLGLSESSARYGSYPMLADAVTTSFARPAHALDQLYRRLVFNIAVGNNDDHLRNVAAFWDGHELELTPAYDLTPQPRSTQVSNQAIGVTPDGDRASQLWVARKAAAVFRLTPRQARAVEEEVVGGIRTHLDAAADAARLSSAEKATLLGREILNPYVFYDQP